jgi:hypothetical protein
MSTWLDQTHLDSLLSPTVRARDDLDYLANKAEREVIAHYTRRREDVRFRVDSITADATDGTGHLNDTTRDAVVLLRYYKADPNNIDTSDPQRQQFVDAFRAETAGVIEHMAETESREAGIASRSQGARSVSYDTSAPELLPPGFGRHLKPFDLRPRSAHV